MTYQYPSKIIRKRDIREASIIDNLKRQWRGHPKRVGALNDLIRAETTYDLKNAVRPLKPRLWQRFAALVSVMSLVMVYGLWGAL